jgi:predicted lipoprotein with Yx(FWY)xxD motif
VSLGLAGAGTLAASQVQAAPALVKTASGHILVNARGLTLYVFAIDKANKSVCYNACAKYWPPLVLPKGMKAPTTMPGISGKFFGVAMRAGGQRQLTFHGAPLYTFIKDKEAGDMYGQGLVAAGGYWWVVAVNTPKASSSGGSGY